MRKTFFLFSAQYFPTAYGVERYTYNLAKRLVAVGHRAVIITSNVHNLQEYELSEGIEIYRIPCINLLRGRFPIVKINKSYFKTMKKLKKEKIDLVIVTTRFYLHSLLGARFSKKVGVKAIMLEHGTSHFTVGSKVFDKLGHVYEHFITYLNKRYIKDFYGVSKACNEWLLHFKIEAKGVLYNSIDIDNIKYIIENNTRNIKEEFKISNTDINIIFVGRLVKEKGILNLLDAFKMIREKYNNINLFIAGDGPLYSKVKTFEDNKIRVLGKVQFEDIILLLSFSDIYCLPTEYAEGFPTSVLEACACKSYVITTDRGGSKELIKDESFGSILKNTKIATIRDEIIKVIENDILRESAIKKSYKLLINNFEWKVTSKKVIDICLKSYKKG